MSALARPLVLVVVVTYNSSRHVEACLASLLAQEDADVAIEVVDNGSSDGTPALVRRSFPTVALDEANSNLGFGRANNRVLARRSADWIALVNPDTVVPPRALATCVAALVADPSAGVAGLRHRGEDGAEQATAFPFPGLLNLAGESLGLDRLLGARFSTRRLEGFRPERKAHVDWLQGSFLVIRREALRTTGVFDADYFMYGEDVDWGRRLASAGYAALYLPEPVIVHVGGGSVGTAAPELFVEAWKGRLRYFRRHRGRAATVVATALTATAILTRLLVREGQGALLALFGRPRPAALLHRIALFRRAARWVVGGMPLASPGSQERGVESTRT